MNDHAVTYGQKMDTKRHSVPSGCLHVSTKIERTALFIYLLDVFGCLKDGTMFLSADPLVLPRSGAANTSKKISVDP